MVEKKNDKFMRTNAVSGSDHCIVEEGEYDDDLDPNKYTTGACKLCFHLVGVNYMSAFQLERDATGSKIGDW
jgi:hypothetical protein